MKRDDVIRMAREAGFREPNPHDGCMGLAFDYREGTDTGASLERFAQAAYAAGAAAEREACARVCEHKAAEWAEGETSGRWQSECAAAIRARGQA